ncbi:hypothetical protein [Rhodophyticola porphyridii]|uniref:hypothetical protein n=1 Tax=Rhodophyticola porphyridii TaxID=1852017 RepID=UPI0035D0FA77
MSVLFAPVSEKPPESKLTTQNSIQLYDRLETSGPEREWNIPPTEGKRCEPQFLHLLASGEDACNPSPLGGNETGCVMAANAASQLVDHGYLVGLHDIFVVSGQQCFQVLNTGGHLARISWALFGFNAQQTPLPIEISGKQSQEKDASDVEAMDPGWLELRQRKSRANGKDTERWCACPQLHFHATLCELE